MQKGQQRRMPAKISLFKCLSISLSLILYGLSAWSGPCGKYRAKGVVRPTSNGLTLIIAEGTKSQITVESNSAADISLSAYVNNFIEASFNVEKMPDGTLLKTNYFYDIKRAIPDPLSAQKNEKPTAFTQSPCKPSAHKSK